MDDPVQVDLRESPEQSRFAEERAGQVASDPLGPAAGAVAHDLANVLAVVVNYSNFLEVKIEDETALNDLRQVIAAANRGVSLTHRLMALSLEASA